MMKYIIYDIFYQFIYILYNSIGIDNFNIFQSTYINLAIAQKMCRALQSNRLELHKRKIKKVPCDFELAQLACHIFLSLKFSFKRKFVPINPISTF